jgi:hypothetical protein
MNSETANGRYGDTAQEKNKSKQNEKLTANEREYMKRISPQRTQSFSEIFFRFHSAFSVSLW